VDFVPVRDEIRASYAEGMTTEVRMHDGSVVRLHKDSGQVYNIQDRQAALRAIAEHDDAGRTLTGLLYIDRDAPDLHKVLGTSRRPLNSLKEKDLCPGSKVLDSINAGLR